MPHASSCSVPRVDALEKVTGKAVYPSDYSFPDMLHLRIVRATEAHARIKKIDTDSCLGIEGCIAFVRRMFGKTCLVI
ncbi:MAG: hypothetical protein NHB14_01735 [Desulfosporosinus sp.]|nr:hypothetical protein [Desulfosporosinus sp.]